MRPMFVPLALACSAACASSGKPDSGIAMPSDRIVASDNQVVIRTSVPPNARVTLPVPAARAFDVLKAVYEELGIPAGIYDAANRRIGNTNFWKTRKLGTSTISAYLHCGESLTGNIADSYRIYFSVMSEVRSDGNDTSELETAVTAYARNMEGTSSDPIVCGTTGQLEDRIQKGVLTKVGAPSK